MKKKIITVVVAILVIGLIIGGHFAIPPLYEMVTFEEINQGFEAKSEDSLRIMSFNVRCTNVGKETMEDRIGIVSQTMLDSSADSIGVQEATPEWMAAFKETISKK